MSALPKFPVDKSSLDLLWRAVHIDEGAQRSSLSDTLDMLSMLGGSDPEAFETEGTVDTPLGEAEVHVLRDAFYSPHDCIAALIAEIRRLRELQPEQQ